MAEILSQNEIDDLLNSSLGDEVSEDAPSENMGDVGASPSGKQKVFKPPKKDNSSFKFEYRSPVIKKDRVIFNPNVSMESTQERIVVRSLPNYADYLRKKKTTID